MKAPPTSHTVLPGLSAYNASKEAIRALTGRVTAILQEG